MVYLNILVTNEIVREAEGFNQKSNSATKHLKVKRIRILRKTKTFGYIDPRKR